MTDYPYQVMPNLAIEEYEALKADIAARGVQVPIEFDEDGNVLDGHHRLRACAELGITEYPTITRKGMTEDEKLLHAYRLNTARRHLTADQMLTTVADVLRRFPDKSNREIASILGISHPTVGKYRRQLEQMGQVEKVTTRVGTDGKRYATPDRDARLLGRTSFTCCICGRDAPASYVQTDRGIVNVWGNDPWPVAIDGDCCSECARKMVDIRDQMPEGVVNEHFLGSDWREVLECAQVARDALRERGHVDEYGNVWDWQDEFAAEFDAELTKHGLHLDDRRRAYQGFSATTKMQLLMQADDFSLTPLEVAKAMFEAIESSDDVAVLTEIRDIAKGVAAEYAAIAREAAEREADLAQCVTTPTN